MSLDPDPAEMRRLGYRAVDLAVEHLATLRDRRVARRYGSAELQRVVDEPLPREGLGVEPSLERWFAELLPRATLVNHPRFFAYIPGPGSYVGALGEFIAAATNLFCGTWLGGASMAQLELCVLDWLVEAIGLTGRWPGIVTTGGSMAGLGALAAARTRLTSRDRGVLYVGEEAHYSVAKAARVLGFDDDQVRRVPADDDQRIPVAALQDLIARDLAGGREPFFVCATAGTTSTGAIDPIPEIAALCERHGVWLHVDAAYGGAAMLLPEMRARFAGVERADSIALDPHKWLYAPFECGVLLTRHEAALRGAFTADGEYMQDVPRDEVNFFERGPELSRGARALKLWLLLRAVGVDAIAGAVAEDMRLCRLAHDLLDADPRIEIATPPQLSVFSFRLAEGGETAGRRLIEDLLEDGHVMLSSSRVRGEFVLRFCVANHRTTRADVESSVARILALI